MVTARRNPPRPVKEALSVREEFLAAGRRLFAEKGFEGVSVKDLAAATGHNSALVSYHFHGKEGLFRECLAPLFGAGMANAENVLQAPNSEQDFMTRFQLFWEAFVRTHLEHQDLCLILQRDLHTGVVKELLKGHVWCVHDLLRDFLDAAKKRKFVRTDLESDLISKLMLLSMFHLVAADRFHQELGEQSFLSEKRRARTVQNAVKFFLQGCLAGVGE